jgi:predicted nuclease of predicted toxin-antitoxin system
VKLLFDENLSPLLVSRLADLYPDSVHVHEVGLGNRDDQEIWQYATTNAFVIATKDSDFAERSAREPLAPKILWIRLGNCVTNAVEMLLRARHAEILRFVDEPGVKCFAMGSPIVRRNSQS